MKQWKFTVGFQIIKLTKGLFRRNCMTISVNKSVHSNISNPHIRKIDYKSIV